MKPHEERVVAEELELSEKITKLRTFMEGDLFIPLPLIEQKALQNQLYHMVEYHIILKNRIRRFSAK